MDRNLELIENEAARIAGLNEPSETGAWSDWIGMTASIGCAIHCAAMPFVIAYLPALGLSFLADESFHQWMAVGCFVIALVAFIPGIRKHGRWSPIAMASVGLVMISVAAFGFAGECCPSCDAEAAAATSTDAAATDVAVCTDEDCALCAHDNPSTAEADSDVSYAGLFASTQLDPSWTKAIVPWLTPIGGLVLVSAHLLNRRFGCLCGCCGVEASDEAVA